MVSGAPVVGGAVVSVVVGSVAVVVVAAVAGAVFVLHQAAFRDENYDVGFGISVFVAAVIGGLGSPLGGILGAVYLRGAQWLLPGNWQILASSVGVLLVLLMIPDGLAGLWYRTRDQLIRAMAGAAADNQPDPDDAVVSPANGSAPPATQSMTAVSDTPLACDPAGIS